MLIAKNYHPAFDEDGVYSMGRDYSVVDGKIVVGDTEIPVDTDKPTVTVGTLVVVRDGALYGVKTDEITDPITLRAMLKRPDTKVVKLREGTP